MKKRFSLLAATSVLCLLASMPSAATLVCVEDGAAQSVIQEGSDWQSTDGALTNTGQVYLWSAKAIGPGSFTVTATLSIKNLEGSAASFVIGGPDSNFGFSSRGGELFIEGPFFGGPTRSIASNSVPEGEPFSFSMKREQDTISFAINGETVHQMSSPRDLIGQVGFRPWRSTMSIQDFVIEGNLMAPLERMPEGFTLPTIDLALDTERQVIIDQEAGQYLGHPTTVLLEDNQTMIAVYPKGHGRGAVVMKRSTDGGLTWSERLPVPENWATSKETPTIHRVIDPEGVKRLIMFSGLYPIRMAVSEDDGHTWTPLEPIGDYGGIVAMSDLVRQQDGDYLAYFHDDGRFLRNEGERGPFVVYKIRSEDGGLTWSQPEPIVSHPVAHLCEPGIIRSPSGDQMVMLLRENSRRFNSFYCVSSDEGETWSEPKQLPASLTGDRHVLRYAPDGRLIVTFRDMAHDTPTHGDFVAWVGTYEDIIEGREGQYRVRLLDNKQGSDTGYAGLEVLPDGTLVATTYCHLYEGEPPLIASVRFQLSELDAIAEKMHFEQHDVFISGEDGYHTYRIPALLTTQAGTLLAFCEGRKTSSADHGDIDLLVKRSTDGGQTWSDQHIIHEEGGDDPITIGNPCPVIDQETGRVWMTFCRNNDDVFVTYSDDDGVSWSQPSEITTSVKKPEWGWYATGPGIGIQKQKEPHKGRLIIPCDHRERDEAGRWIKRSHIFYNDDGGETWQLGNAVADHTDECQVAELPDGRLMINMRNYWEADGGIAERGGMRAIAYSDDGGETWGDLQFDETLIEPICQASLFRYSWPQDGQSRLLFSNPASTSQRHMMTVRMSTDEGETWPVSRVIYPDSAAYSCLGRLPNGDMLCLYERNGYGKITLARWNMTWLMPRSSTD